MTKRQSRRADRSVAFAKNLTALMTEKGMSVREAALAAGVSPSTIVDWRAGTAGTDYVSLCKLAKALGVSLSYLLTGEDDSRPNGELPSVTELFDDGGFVFDGFAHIKITRLVPKTSKKGNQSL